MLWSHNVPGSSKITANIISAAMKYLGGKLSVLIRPEYCNNEFWSGICICSLCFGTIQLFTLCIHTHRELYIIGSLCQLLTMHFSLLVHTLDCCFVS